jgi:hypothetical protein
MRGYEGQVVDEDERTLELPSHAAPRAERSLWIGKQHASVHSSQMTQLQLKNQQRLLYACKVVVEANFASIAFWA